MAIGLFPVSDQDGLSSLPINVWVNTLIVATSLETEAGRHAHES